MAKKSIIDIDVNDEKFKEFLNLFNEYKDSLDEMPKAWQQLGEAVGGTGTIFNKSATDTMKVLHESADHIGKMAESLQKATKAQEQFYHATTVSNTGMSNLVKSSKHLAKNLFGIGKELFKLASFGSMAGSAAMFGLGDSAYRRERESRGLGLSTGQISSFKTHMAPFGNPDEMLNSAANAQFDMTKWWALTKASGLPLQQALHTNPMQLAMDIANNEKSTWSRLPVERRTGAMAGALGFSELGATRESLNRLVNTPGLRKAESDTMKDVGVMGFSDKVGDEYTKMIVTLHKAGIEIESVLIDKLAPLAKPLSNMALLLARDFGNFMNAPGTKKAIGNIGMEIEKSVRFLGSKDFKSDIKDFGSAIKDLTTLIVDVTNKYQKLNPDLSIGDWWKAGKDIVGGWLNPVGHSPIKAFAPNTMELLRSGVPANMRATTTSSGTSQPATVLHKLIGQANRGRGAAPQNINIKVTAPSGFGVERQTNASGH